MTHHDHHPVIQRTCDVAVIGGSAGGLAAALQLARQRRSVVVVDDGTPRNAPAAHMHGYLGWDGAPPGDLVAAGREEVRRYGGEVLSGRVVSVRRADDGRAFHLSLTGGHSLLARRVVAATGIVDELPAVEGLAERWGREVIHCPFCHGFEVRDQRVVQILTHPMGLHPTPLLRHLTDRLTVVVHEPEGIEDAAVQPLVAAGTPVLREKVSAVVAGSGDAAVGVELASGETLQADAVLVGTRFRPRIEALTDLDVTTVEHPSGLGDVVDVDPMGQTSVPGLFAAGNLTDPGLQVLPAAAHGSRVGAMVAFSLADEDLAQADPSGSGRASGERTEWEHRYAGDDPTWSANPNGTLVAEAASLPPGRALDVGAGEGADAVWLAERGWQVTAADISGNALARVAAEASRRGLDVDCLQVDVTDADPFDGRTFDLVSLQYGSFHRAPDQRGLRNLLDTVAPGGTLLVVSHDLTLMREPLEPGELATQTRMFDPDAYVGVEEIAAALTDQDEWRVEVHETRTRPPGAASTHHVADVVLRATRFDG